MILLFFLSVALWILWNVYRLFGYRYHSFDDSVVLVTGATSEVGRRLCVQLRAEGASIIAWDYSKTRLEELQKEIVGMKLQSSSRANRSYSPVVSSLPQTSTVARDGGRGGGSPPSPAASPNSPIGNAKGSSAFFEVAMVDLSSRIQVQRAMKDLLSTLPALCAASFSGKRRQHRHAYGAPCVDAVFNAAHVSPGKGLADRTEDTTEKLMATNAVAPLLLARFFCPLMLERKEGGHFVTFTAALGATLIDSASPDYAGSQWGAVGAHYSIRAWLRRLQKERELPGEVRTTLVCFDAIHLGLPGPAASSSFSPSSFLSSSAALWGRTAAPPSLASASGSPPQSLGEGGVEDRGSSPSKGDSQAAGKGGSTSAAQTASLALDRLVQRSLRAVGRGEDYFCLSYRAAVAPGAFLLPVPWMSAVMKVIMWRGRRKGSATEGPASGKQD